MRTEPITAFWYAATMMIAQPMKTLSIKEFEQITRISAYTLRYFDKIGLLSPRRDMNGYRIYTVAQIAVAEMITILQKANVPNKNIKRLLLQYNDGNTIAELKQHEAALAAEITTLQRTLLQLQSHIAILETIQAIRPQLDCPCVEICAAREVGILTCSTDDILDFFSGVAETVGDSAWYLKQDYGFILSVSDIRACGYPLRQMFSNHPDLVHQSSYIIPAGKYLTMYAAGSLENNMQVHTLIEHARQSGYHTAEHLYIQNISGPVIESEKKNFLIKIAIAIEE